MSKERSPETEKQQNTEYMNVDTMLGLVLYIKVIFNYLPVKTFFARECCYDGNQDSTQDPHAQSAGAVEYTDSISVEV